MNVKEFDHFFRRSSGCRPSFIQNGEFRFCRPECYFSSFFRISSKTGVVAADCRDYATTLQIRRTVPPPPLPAQSCDAAAQLSLTCPVHGRATAAWGRRPDYRLYEIAARLDTLHEDVVVTPGECSEHHDPAAASAAAASAADRDVVSPFYHELEPTALDSTTSCRHH